MLFYDPHNPSAGAVAVPQGRFTEPITETDYHELVASNNEQNTDPPPIQPNWDQFVGQLLSNADLNQVLSTAIATAPAATIGLPAALAQVADKGISQFAQVYAAVIQAGSATQSMRTTWREYAIAANLPQDFVNIL